MLAFFPAQHSRHDLSLENAKGSDHQLLPPQEDLSEARRLLKWRALNLDRVL